ncbi:uncharacterized protein LOC62_04G006493 [Vanrija pseudolonga]|uniref:Uncharacterized protein n=1 Tax=Vanrija pseudolonga TaxID=143232 RepID=A0AAF0YA77_9TREE|nr:hypothetical protein LOC62_04G006493 [Vanrija pseudolonga]
MRTQFLVISALAAFAAAQSTSDLPFCEDATGTISGTGSAHPAATTASAPLAGSGSASHAPTPSAATTSKPSAGDAVTAPHFIVLAGAVVGGAWLAL